MNAGRARFRVRIEQQTSAQDASGQPLNQWTLFASRRAEQVPGAGGEHVEGQQQLARANVLWKLRYVDGVKPSMRIVFAGKVFEILDVNDPDGLKRSLEVSSAERVGETP